MPAERTRSWNQRDMSCNQLVWTAPVAGAPCPELIESTALITEPDFDDGPPPLVDAPPLGFPPPPGEFILCPPPEKSVTKRSSPHSKKKPENHIPRPPNAFILFRSSFIKSRHVSQEVETNHSTLSKIIGITWKNLPDAERQTWHAQAKREQEEHRRRFPKYAFRPQQAKGKGGTGPKRKVREVEPKDLKRCAKIAELLGQGMKGSELNAEIAEFDKHHIPEIITRFEVPITERAFRRSSSAPIPDTELTIEQQSFLPKEKSPVPRKIRSVSVRPTRRTTPIVENVHSASSTTVVAPTHIEAQLDPSKEETKLDFTSFSFDNVGSPASNYLCDPLVESFVPTNPPCGGSLIIDIPYMAGDWSQCSSPVSPHSASDFLSTPSASPSFSSSSADSYSNAYGKSFADFTQTYPVYQEHSFDGLCHGSFLSMDGDYGSLVNVPQLDHFNMDSFVSIF